MQCPKWNQQLNETMIVSYNEVYLILHLQKKYKYLNAASWCIYLVYLSGISHNNTLIYRH